MPRCRFFGLFEPTFLPSVFELYCDMIDFGALDLGGGGGGASLECSDFPNGLLATAPSGLPN